MTNEEGTSRSTVLEVIPTVIPPLPAGPLRFTVQMEVPVAVSAVWLQLTDTTRTIAWAVPPVADVAMARASHVAPKALLKVSVAAGTLAANVTSTVATVPLEIVLGVGPTAIHIWPTGAGAHVRVLLAAASAFPATTDIDAAPVEYPSVH
jgi:hypothetical protein